MNWFHSSTPRNQAKKKDAGAAKCAPLHAEAEVEIQILKMNAPVGGDLGGIAAVIVNSPGEVSSLEETNCCSTAIADGSGRLGVTTMAGCGALATQQLA
jgi:hypothetical protein